MPIPVLKMQIGFFNNAMKDLISQTLDVSNYAVTYKNITSAWSRGLETEFDWQVKTWLSVFSNYVFQVSRNEYAGKVRKIFDENKVITNKDELLIKIWW